MNRVEKTHIQKLTRAKAVLAVMYILICGISLVLVGTNKSWTPFISVAISMAILFGYMVYRINVFERTGITLSNPPTKVELFDFYKALMGKISVLIFVVLISTATAVAILVLV